MPDPAPSTRPGFALVFVLALVLAGITSGASLARAAAPDPPPDRVLAEGWTVEGYIDPAAGEGQRAQVALDADGAPIAVWANRATNLVPFEIVWSRFDGAGWSPATRAFAPSLLENQLPRISRAADGALWLAWLQFDDRFNSASLFSSLIVARRVDGVWAAPETVATGLSLPNRELFPSEFAVHAVSRDEAWVVHARGPADNPFSLDRDLYSARYAAGAWSAPILVSDGGLAETRPEITAGPDGRPVVFFGFANATSILWAKTWTGAAWEQGANDQLSALAVYEHAVQPDTSGAVRMVAFVREELGSGQEDHVREYVWDAAGFRPGPIIFQAAVAEGGANEPPDWRGLSLATSDLCNPPCPPGAVPRYHVLWTDFSPGHLPAVLSIERRPAGYGTLDSPGGALLPDDSYPNAAWDAALDRWYAVWTAPPSIGARLRAKFAWTQTFAGDVAIGGRLVAPDTARIIVLSTGDATGREFRIYRLSWDDTVTNPPFAPPIPAGAVELPGSPFTGPCPFQVDDVVGIGRYFYYVELIAQGTFPGDYARSSVPIVVTGGEPPPPPPPATTAFLAPHPQPAFGGSVAFPFELATAAADVQLVIHDSRGRAVRRFDLGSLAAGSYRGSNLLRWDGRDDAGRRSAAGVYWARLWVDERVIGEARRVVFAE
jgi:hypothetical protein